MSFVIQPENNLVDSCMIFLHGLGDTCHGWKSTIQRLSKNFPSTRFILPTAPSQYVDIVGTKTTSWYNIYTLDDSDEKELERTRKYLVDLVKEQTGQGISCGRIVIGGFSQGAAVSLFTGLTVFDNKTIGGIVALSGYLPLKDQIEALLSAENKKAPEILIAHGTKDLIIPYRYALETKDVLKRCNIFPIFHTYKEMDHSVSEEEIKHVEQFLKMVLVDE